MAATIKIKNSSTAGAAPTSSDLVQGELAVNVTDKRLFTENASGTIVELGTNPSVPVTFPDGSASAPSLTNDGDINTGLFFPAADTVGITTGGTERARVDSSGNLGLGVTPSAWSGVGATLQVGVSAAIIGNSVSSSSFLSNAYYDGSNYKYIGTGYAARLALTSGAYAFQTAASGTAGNAITFTQAMTLDASGNLGIGTTSPATKLHVVGNTRITADIESSGNSVIYSYNGSSAGTINAGIYLVGSDSSSRFYTGNLERARIDSSGNLLVGTTSVFGAGGISIQPSAGAPTVDVKGSATTNGSSVFNVYSTGASAYRFYVGMGGTISATSTTITGISDRRLKENIRDLDDGLEKVMALQPRKFDWKEGKGADVKNARGFIAQEFEQVFPDLIEQWKDEPPEGEEPYKAVRADLIPTLVKAIQEQQAIITDLTNRITALEGAK